MTLRIPTAGQKQAMKLILRMRLDWRESGNVYSRDPAFLTSSPARRPRQKLRVAPESLVEWLRFWQLAEDASVEGEVRFEDRSEDTNLTPLRLKTVENASGPLPAESGAAADQVGSGAAFHQWRATPQYELWCREGSSREQ